MADINIYESQAKEIRKIMKDKELLTKRFGGEAEDDYLHTTTTELLYKNKKLEDTVIKVLNKESNAEFIKETKRTLKLIQQHNLMHKRGDKTIVKDLKNLQEILKVQKDKAERQWMYKTSQDGVLLPYRIEEIHYRTYRDDDPTHIAIKLGYFGYSDMEKMKSQDTWVSIYKESLTKDNGESRKLYEVLDDVNCAFESEELNAQYDEQMERLFQLHKQLGVQFLGKNKCRVINDSYYSRSIGNFQLLEAGGIRSRLVVNTDPKKSLTMGEEGRIKVPTHPYILCYDITKYRDCLVHVDNLEKYEYDTSIKDKLVLPSEVSTLLDILIEQEDDLMEDIVKGKTGGIIVIATGAAGLGKTLTAEVYSEVMEKPLYVVQSSQLGIKIEDLEKNLANILDRASRWNAILMIDEADTYIHERGEDVVQNCIVGVFLRLLEYYKGVLFMTSNRANVIDDAIMSRCTAHIEYEYPPKDDLIKIWKILSNQFGAKMTDEDILEIVEKYPKMGGRDVKNTVKLMKLVAKKTSEKCDLKMLEKLLPFMNFRAKKILPDVKKDEN